MIHTELDHEYRITLESHDYKTILHPRRSRCQLTIPLKKSRWLAAADREPCRQTYRHNCGVAIPGSQWADARMKRLQLSHERSCLYSDPSDDMEAALRATLGK